MKRVQLQLPDAVVAWVDAQTDGIESRASFLRRAIVGLMKAEQQRRQTSALTTELAAAQPRRTGGLEEA